MTGLRIWAPHARSVRLRMAEREHELRATGDGQFEIEQVACDQDYVLMLDGGAPRADPRSRRQPHGFDGPSQLPHHELVWQDADFEQAPLAAAIFYELHVGTFTPEGTYAAAAQHLDHLLALGVTHVELMPLATFPGQRGWGYDGVNLYAPHPSYGTPRDLQQFVARCHARGLAVVIDVVYNHLGPDGNYLNEFGPYFSDRHHTPWGAAINLDGPGHVEVRRFLIDNALMWLRDYHFDGLRLDAIHALRDDSPDPFLGQLADEVRAEAAKLGRPFIVVAESNANDPRVVHAAADGGIGLDAQWNDDFHHALHTVLTGERAGYYAEFGTLELLAQALQHGYVYDGSPDAGQPRRRSTSSSTSTLLGQHFVCALQNHDQVGNRAQGERIGMLVNEARARIGAALLFMSPFVPLLFQGEEWNASTPFLYFTDHVSPELAAAVREGRRREFAAFVDNPEDIPDPQARETFERSKLHWQELSKPKHSKMLEWYRALSKLRRTHPDLKTTSRNQLQVHYNETAQTLTLQRNVVTLQLNLSQTPITLARPKGTPTIFHPAPPVVGSDNITLGPEACCIWT